MKRIPKITTPLAAIAAFLALTAAVPVAGATGGETAAPTPASAARHDPAAGSSLSDVDGQAAAALASQRGISVAEAKNRLGRQKSLGERGERLEKSLAGRSGGDYLDDNGNLVVTTLDAAGDAVVARGGAQPKRVDDSAAHLDSIMDQLNQEASRDGAGSLHGWYVDVPTNTVVVTATSGANDARAVAMAAVAKRFGASVRIESRPAEEAPRTAEWMVGGYEYRIADGRACSVGFNTVDAANRNVVLTAGHCVKQAGTMTRNGYSIGATRTADFPGNDYGTFWNSYPKYWQPTVSVYKYNGTYVDIRGQWDSPGIGTSMCKSGRTTGYTCGTIKALNQTVNYGTHGIVYGLVRHNACVEGGDSGGSNIGFYNSKTYALGVTSGAAAVSENDSRCRSKVGLENISWYQPIGEALQANGLSLVYKP